MSANEVRLLNLATVFVVPDLASTAALRWWNQAAEHLPECPTTQTENPFDAPHHGWRRAR
jgi:hypothetical protein